MRNEVRTIIRCAVFVLALINVTLKGIGLSPLEFDSETLTEFITDGWLIVSGLWAVWKDNPFSAASKRLHEYWYAMKSGDATFFDLMKMVDDAYDEAMEEVEEAEDHE